MDEHSIGDERPHILSRVDGQEFVGRARELKQIVAHPKRRDVLGLLLLLEPSAGVSELLRQAYDELFHQHGKTIPIYFALSQDETTAVSAAIEFLNAFLAQYLAFRRNEPELSRAVLTLEDLLALAPPPDYEWIEQLVEAFNQQRFGDDDRGLIRWCLSAPQRIPKHHGRAFVMLDAVPLREQPDNGPSLGPEMVRVFSRSGLPYAIAGLRRQLLGVAHSVNADFDSLEVIRLDRLSDKEGQALVEQVARRQRLGLSDEARDLLVQQFECSPFFMTAFIQAAHERDQPLTSYLACEKLYVDELMGGRINRYYTSLLEEIAPDPELRKGLIRVLYESTLAAGHRASFETWKRNLHLENSQLEAVLRALHIQEFVTWDGSSIEAGGGAAVWRDYLQIRYRLELAGEPRALVVAETVTNSLKRAPQTMARYYRRVAAVGLSDLLARFDCQSIPAALFDYTRFSKEYKGAEPQEIARGLDADTELVTLPQTVHVATFASFNADIQQFLDEERCVVAHAFEGGNYTESSEVVWLAAEIDSKLEADRDLAATWCERLAQLARQSGFGRILIWLIAREGFSPEAMQMLAERGAYGSSRQQLDLITSRLSDPQVLSNDGPATDDFEIAVPMGGDNELIVARIVEQIARRLDFPPEAIAQIKHAVVEACINAAEHSLSPDQKLYQRVRFENDKLVITISSRGIVPTGVELQNGAKSAAGEGGDNAAGRRGWGLGIITTLMDEVEFERVDDGTSLRMTKYLRK